MIIQVSTLILVITVGEREIQVWHADVNLSAAFVEETVQGWNSPLRVDVAMFQRRLSLRGNTNNVIFTDKSPQLTFRFTWPAWRQ